MEEDKAMTEENILLSKENDAGQQRDIEHQEKINSESQPSSWIKLLKSVFFSSLIIEFTILIVCIGLSITDIVTDILLSIKFYNGFDHNCLEVYNKTTIK